MQIKLANQIFSLHSGWVVLTVTAFLILINLSWWQLNRAQQKTQQLQQLAVMQQQGPADWQGLLQLELSQADGLTLQDELQWLKPYVWLLDNQIVDGKVGYDVIVPVSDTSSQQVLLVNLGWIGAGQNRSQLPQPVIPARLQLDGLLRTQNRDLLLLGQNFEANGQWPARIQRADYAAMAQQLARDVLPAMLYQQNDTYFTAHYKAVVMPPYKHRGYAVQWLLLALAVVGVALAASHKGRA